jgi:2-dehydro-3-deoxy-D-gluconate 5-dehydrogenase
MPVDLFNLEGKKALVTGGTRGLGHGIAQGLREAGADVAIIGHSDRVADVAQASGFVGVRADLGDRQQLQRGFAEALSALGTLDILVNSHGIQRRHRAEEFPIDDWDLVLEVNLTSVFELCQLAAAVMLPRGYGKIINVASVLSYSGGLTVPAYAASKGGVAQLTMAFANEWAKRGINVNAIAPGYMATDLNTALMANAERSRQIMDRVPAGRWGTPEDLKGAAIFLASRASDFVHGTIVAVDGGWLSR